MSSARIESYRERRHHAREELGQHGQSVARQIETRHRGPRGKRSHDSMQHVTRHGTPGAGDGRNTRAAKKRRETSHGRRGARDAIDRKGLQRWALGRKRCPRRSARANVATT